MTGLYKMFKMRVVHCIGGFMNKISLALISCLFLASCVSEQEQREATYRYEQLMKNQCEVTLGFPAGGEGYMNCRMFYENLFDQESMMGTMSYNRVQQIQNRVYQTTNNCRRYWGGDRMDKAALWSCVQQTEQSRIDEIIHQREMAEQEEILKRSLKEADEERELQRRIDMERHRVAREKHKRPEDVKCKTHNKKHGYVQVKCK